MVNRSKSNWERSYLNVTIIYPITLFMFSTQNKYICEIKLKSLISPLMNIRMQHMKKTKHKCKLKK